MHRTCPLSGVMRTLGDVSSTVRRRELLGERGGDGWVGEAPPHDASVGVVPPVATLGPNAVARVKVVHGVQLGAETAGRHDDVDKVRKILLDGFRVAAHAVWFP